MNDSLGPGTYDLESIERLIADLKGGDRTHLKNIGSVLHGSVGQGGSGVPLLGELERYANLLRKVPGGTLELAKGVGADGRPTVTATWRSRSSSCSRSR